MRASENATGLSAVGLAKAEGRVPPQRLQRSCGGREYCSPDEPFRWLFSHEGVAASGVSPVGLCLPGDSPDQATFNPGGSLRVGCIWLVIRPALRDFYFQWVQYPGTRSGFVEGLHDEVALAPSRVTGARAPPPPASGSIKIPRSSLRGSYSLHHLQSDCGFHPVKPCGGKPQPCKRSTDTARTSSSARGRPWRVRSSFSGRRQCRCVRLHA